jgi:hypothetical protein
MEQSMGQKAIPVSQAREGMVLAQTVANAKGMVLCAEGTTLTSLLISRFEKIGVEMIRVQWEEIMTEQALFDLNEKLLKRFSKVRNDSLLGLLKSIIMERLDSAGK